MEEGYETKTAFDLGISTLGRINYWLYNANNFNFNNKPDDYFNSLIILYHEIIPFIQKKKERVEYHDNQMKKIRNQLNRLINIINSNQRLKTNTAVPAELFESLQEWDREIRVDLKRTGLLMREGEDVYGAMA